jgi:cell division FtsZ-interacting protein ZapD
MDLLRSNVEVKAMETKTDAVQYKLDPLLRNDLVIITLPATSKFFPNISSNKYAVNVHFGKNLASTTSKLVKFKLGIASF